MPLEGDGSLREAVRRRLLRDVSLPPDVKGMEQDMKNKLVGYAGEEISKCHPLTLAQILPALPPATHGGSINSLHWLGRRSQEFLLHPERCLLPEGSYDLPKLPGKVHIEPQERLKVAQELVSRNICRWINYDEVHTIRGQKLLNGMFGVAISLQLSKIRDQCYV